MAPMHPLDDSYDTGQVLYSSLLVLGLDAVSLEHSLRTPVNQKMFVRMNKKLGEHILHFLFTCIDQEKASKVFRDCWPVLDKKQEYQFHKATFEWYKLLQKEYGQPLPAVVAKTFLSPGGPKFTSTLMTLSMVALHSSVNKRVPEHTLIHFPTLSRNPNQNCSKLKLLQMSKKLYLQEFIAKQKRRQAILSKLQEKSRYILKRYHSLCSEDDMTKQELEQTLQDFEKLSPQHKDNFLKSPLSEFQGEIMLDMSKLNSEAGDLWGRVGTFQNIESSSWKVLSPLLDGTMSLSHLDGSLFTPTVPETVYKDYAVDINKIGLQGLYADEKLNLLCLIQYSTFALRSVLKAAHTIHSQTRPESAKVLKVLTGRAASMSESMSDLSSKLNTLLPTLIDSVSTLRQCSSTFMESLDHLELEGKLQLCPPTPPLSLVSTPVGTPVSAHKSKKLLPLHLTPGILGDRRRTVHCMNGITPTRLLSSININRAAKRSPKADVMFSSSTHLDDSVVIDTREEANKVEEEAGLTLEMVTVDCRGSYQLQQEQKLHEQKHQNSHGHTKHQPKGKKGRAEEKRAETLLDAIEKIDITPKSKLKKSKGKSFHRTVGPGKKSLALSNSSDLPQFSKAKQTPIKSGFTSENGTHCAKLIDYTPCINKIDHLSVTGAVSCEDPFKTPVPLQQLCRGKVSAYSSLKCENGLAALCNIDNKSPSNDELIARMALLTQSPARDAPTPLASKILSKFEDVNFAKVKNSKSVLSSTNDVYCATVEELRHQTKANLNNLMKQVQEVKKEYPAKVEKMKERRKTECGFNSKFLTFVENIKSGKDSVQTTELKDSCSSSGQNHINNEETYKQEPINSRLSTQSSVARLEALLDITNSDEDDDTFTGNLGKITSLTKDEESFMNSEEFEKTLLQTPGYRSSYLPRDSIFDTLTESILAGEVSSSLLTKEDVQDEIRRESISSRRQSLISLGRMSIGSNKDLSEALSVFQCRMSTDCAGILDESDSCLLYTSMEDFEQF
ncbi:uncharacterized protein [Palaemon carinicauda]|uniref:uncharacterized protein n=1 Tax=Palaemon carinicauda TaxID=392227 RepID=UPI0035B66DAB